jgi:hypothetical protein
MHLLSWTATQSGAASPSIHDMATRINRRLHDEACRLDCAQPFASGKRPNILLVDYLTPEITSVAVRINKGDMGLD